MKQLPDWTINALWAKPVGGRSVSERPPGVEEMNASCTVHTYRPSGKAMTRVVSKPTRSATSLAMKLFKLAVSVPAAHWVLVSAWTARGGTTATPIANNATVSTRARHPPIDEG